VFFEGERIACHVKSVIDRRYTTDPDHMPEAHKAVAEWSPQRFISWAAKTGEHTGAYIAALPQSRDHPEQAYKTCAGILRLAENTPRSRMEEACQQALSRRLFSYRAFSSLLEDQAAPKDDKPIVHDNIRGTDYYSREDYNA
jgi:transposase